MTPASLIRASFLLLTGVAVFLAALFPHVLAKRGHRHCRRTSPQPRSPVPGLLLIPAVRRKMERRGMIYRDTDPDHRWTVQRIDHSKDFDPYCQEVVYATVVLNRQPTVQYHRTCDSHEVFSADPPTTLCQTFERGNHTDTCQPQRSYRLVTVQGRDRYQETFTGCVCSSSRRLSN